MYEIELEQIELEQLEVFSHRDLQQHGYILCYLGDN